MRRLLAIGFIVAVTATAVAKTAESVILWPPSNPALRFTIRKLERTSRYAGVDSYSAEIIVQNVWGKTIRNATFVAYLYDKDKVRVGDGYIQVTDLNPGQEAKITLTASTRGTPESLELRPQSVPPELGPSMKLVSMKVFSVPSGASLKLDGQDVGTTPRNVDLSVGHHVFEFGKEGFANGRYEFDVDPNEASGGSITLELGGLSRDTIELRDGTIITGDLEQVTPTEVVVRIAGDDKRFDRNKVRRILLVERERTTPAGSPSPQH